MAHMCRRTGPLPKLNTKIVILEGEILEVTGDK